MTASEIRHLLVDRASPDPYRRSFLSALCFSADLFPSPCFYGLLQHMRQPQSTGCRRRTLDRYPNRRHLCQFPSSQRRGGRDTNEMPRSLLQWSGRGGHTGGMFGLRPTDHPVCAAKVASRHWIDRASTPPLRGGECCSIPIHSPPSMRPRGLVFVPCPSQRESVLHLLI